MDESIAFTTFQSEIKEKAHTLANTYLAVTAEEIDKESKFPQKNIKHIGKSGLLSLGIPKSKGGIGDDVLATILALEEFATGCASTAMSCLMHYSTLPVLSTLVNKEQEKTFLQPIIDGKWLGSASMSEAGTGSRLWHMNGYVVNKKEHYTIQNSFKSFCTSNNYNNYYLVPVKKSKNSKPNDLSMFIVSSDIKDIKVIGKWDGMGLRGTSSNPVYFNDCKVPKNCRLGKSKNIFPLLMCSVLPLYLVGLSTVYLGIAQKAYNAALEHVKKRVYSDDRKSAAEIETVQRYVGEMRIQISLVRESIHKQCKLLNNFNEILKELYDSDLLADVIGNLQGDNFFLDIAQIKVSACEMAINVTNKAVQICGGAAYVRGHVVERCFRDARAGSIMGPSDDIIKVIVGKKELGLPFPWEESYE